MPWPLVPWKQSAGTTGQEVRDVRTARLEADKKKDFLLPVGNLIAIPRSSIRSIFTVPTYPPLYISIEVCQNVAVSSYANVTAGLLVVADGRQARNEV